MLAQFEERIGGTELQNRLGAIKEFGKMIQFVNIEDLNQFYNDKHPCYYFGQFIVDVLDEVQETIEQLEEENRAKLRELEKFVPPDPEKLRQEAEQQQKYLLYVAGYIEKHLPGVTDKIKEMIEAQGAAANAEEKEGGAA